MDKRKLEEAMEAAGISTGKMQQILGISRSAFYRKRNGISEFTLSEISKMIDVLNLPSADEIFFKKKVS